MVDFFDAARPLPPAPDADERGYGVLSAPAEAASCSSSVSSRSDSQFLRDFTLRLAAKSESSAARQASTAVPFAAGLSEPSETQAACGPFAAGLSEPSETQTASGGPPHGEAEQEYLDNKSAFPAVEEQGM